MAKTLIYQLKAEKDVDRAIDYYKEKSKALGNQFYNELIKAYSHISDHPAIGSNRFAYELNKQSLFSIYPRFKSLTTFKSHALQLT